MTAFSSAEVPCAKSKTDTNQHSCTHQLLQKAQDAEEQGRHHKAASASQWCISGKCYTQPERESPALLRQDPPFLEPTAKQCQKPDLYKALKTGAPLGVNNLI